MSMITRARSLGRHRGKTPMELRTELDAAEIKAIGLTAALDQVAAERNTLEAQLDKAGIELSGALEDLRIEREENTRLRAELANRDAVTVPPMERDTSDGADQATTPIQVLTLHEAFGSTDPAHVPAWART